MTTASLVHWELMVSRTFQGNTDAATRAIAEGVFPPRPKQEPPKPVRMSRREADASGAWDDL